MKLSIMVHIYNPNTWAARGWSSRPSWVRGLDKKTKNKKQNKTKILSQEKKKR
jgi:hypothetical protein